MDYLQELMNARKEYDDILRMYKEKHNYEKNNRKIIHDKMVDKIDKYVFSEIINNKYIRSKYDISLQSFQFCDVKDRINRMLGYTIVETKPLHLYKQDYFDIHDNLNYFNYQDTHYGSYLHMEIKNRHRHIEHLLKDNLDTKYIILEELNIPYTSRYFDYNYIYPYIIMNIKEEYKYNRYFDEFIEEKYIPVDDVKEVKKDVDEYYCNKLYNYYKNSKYNNYMEYRENNCLLRAIKGRQCNLRVNKYTKKEIEMLSK